MKDSNQLTINVGSTGDPLIMGRTWSQIQAMQQGTYKPETISGPIVKPTATEADINLLKEHGIDGLKEKQFHGVIDRLTNSGIVPLEVQS